MTGYKMDTHVHTDAVSSCASISPEDAVACYEVRGYKGIIITEHFYQSYFDRLGELPWHEKLERYWAGYRRARAAAKQLTVLRGLEYRSTESDNDYLVYDVSDAFLAAHPEICTLTQAEAIRLFRAGGATVIQAHPARVGIALQMADGHVQTRFSCDEILAFIQRNSAMPHMPWTEAQRRIAQGDAASFHTPVVTELCSVDCPDALDGMEVYNGNSYWAQDEEKLSRLIEAHPGYIFTSGSDFHEAAHCGRGGMVFAQQPETIKEFVAMLHDPSGAELIH